MAPHPQQRHHRRLPRQDRAHRPPDLRRPQLQQLQNPPESPMCLTEVRFGSLPGFRWRAARLSTESSTTAQPGDRKTVPSPSFHWSGRRDSNTRPPAPKADLRHPGLLLARQRVSFQHDAEERVERCGEMRELGESASTISTTSCSPKPAFLSADFLPILTCPLSCVSDRASIWTENGAHVTPGSWRGGQLTPMSRRRTTKCNLCG